jgi:Fe-S cluster assembly protein SufD
MAVVVKSRTKEQDIFAPFTADLLTAYIRQYDPHDLLAAWRKGSYAHALVAPTPSNTDEDFKYVNFRMLDLKNVTPTHLEAFGNANGTPATLEAIAASRAPVLPERFVTHGTGKPDQGSVYYGSIAEAAVMMPEELATYLQLFNEKFPRRKFASLAQAFMSQGVFLHVCKNSDIQMPRHMYSYLSGSKVMTSLVGLVVVESNARAGFIWDSDAASDAAGFQNDVLDIVLQSGSKLSLMVNQEHARASNSVMTVRAYLEKDAELELVALKSGGKLNQMEIDIQFAGEGAKAYVNGVYVGRGDENFNLLTHQDHRVGHCKSDLLYIGTLAGTSRSNYLGKITIAPRAQRSDAYQKNRNLVLNKGTAVNSSPKLEIGANDVRCTHGATTAKVSDLEMFYMRSRGIDKTTAKVLLADGFLRQVAGRVQSPMLKHAYEQRLNALLLQWGENEN